MWSSMGYLLEIIAWVFVTLPICARFDAGMQHWADQEFNNDTRISAIRSFAPFFSFAAASAYIAVLMYPFIFFHHSEVWRAGRVKTTIRSLGFTSFFLLLGPRWHWTTSIIGLSLAAVVGIVLGFGEGWYSDQKRYRQYAEIIEQGGGIEFRWEDLGRRAMTVRMYHEGLIIRRDGHTYALD